jgi:hypothetical protein
VPSTLADILAVGTKGSIKHMRRAEWLKVSSSEDTMINLKTIKVKRSMENRIVLCANCDANRTLAVSSSGNLICSSCSSQNWIYVSAPIIARFKKYDERTIQERVTVDRYIETLEKEVFFTPNAALV